MAPRLPELVPIPLPALEPVRRLSFTALASFERCSYRYYAERLVGMKALRPAPTDGGTDGLGALDVGDAVHRLLETIDLARSARRRARARPRVVSARHARTSSSGSPRFVAGYCASPLAQRVAALDDVRAEVPFTFEHDGVLIRGFLDVLHLAGESALVVDYKTNVVGEGTPEEIVDQDYRLQRLVYALACFRSGAHRVEVVYHFLERPDATVSALFTMADVPALEAELSDGDRAHPGRTVRPDAERARVRGLSRSRRRLRRPAPAGRASTPGGFRAGLTCDHLVTYIPTMPDDDDAVFRALADPTRRLLLDRLFERDGRTLTELESQLEMTRFGVMKHLRILEGAGLVVSRKAGREKLHYLNPVPIRLIHDRWIDKYTEHRVSALAELKTQLEDIA